MNKISVVINTLNEAHNIAACLETVLWADEIIVVDMHSDDDTQKIARKLGAKVLTHERTGIVEPARNFAITKATNDWVLIVDADERIPKSLSSKIRSLVKDGASFDAIYIPEVNYFFGEWVKGNTLWPDYHPRFINRNKVKWTTAVHSMPIIENAMYLPAEKKYAIHHYSETYKTLNGFIMRNNVYSQKEAEALLANPQYNFRRRHMLLHPIREFRRRFFREKGYTDGTRGLVIALLYAIFKAVSLMYIWEKTSQMMPNDKDKSKYKYLYDLLRDK